MLSTRASLTRAANARHAVIGRFTSKTESLRQKFGAGNARLFSAAAAAHPKTDGGNETFLNGEASQYIEQMHEHCRRDRTSVHASWDAYFTNVERGVPAGQAFMQPPATPMAHVSHAEMNAVSSNSPDVDRMWHANYNTSRIIQLVRGYQTRGHEIAKIDPLGLPASYPYQQTSRSSSEVSASAVRYPAYNFTAADLEKEYDFRVSGMTGFLSPNRGASTLKKLVSRLEETYAGSIGVEYMHITDPAAANFLREALETPEKYSFSKEIKRKILIRTARAQLFENFCMAKYSTTKRFGVDGCETMVVGMKAVTKRAAKNGVESVFIAMPHRGRLNVLMNVMHKPMQQMLSEFQGITGFGGSQWGNTGDVKYHLGMEHDHYDDGCGRYIHMGLIANPSHLEAANPVLIGQVRAQQYYSGDSERSKVLPVVLHGDASFAGQGVVYETLQMSQVPGYQTGGTINIIVNNQIGFTTNPGDAGSGKYCTDIARAINAPIFHVNGDDPEAVTFVAELAVDYRRRFKSDVFIDIVGYRRFGHNELDMPKFTQPHMYTLISKQKPVFELYSQKLIDEGVVTPAEVEEIKKDILNFYNAEYEKSKEAATVRNLSEYQPQWKHMKEPSTVALPQLTGVKLELLKNLGKKMFTLPERFNAHPNIAKQYKNRVESCETGEDLDFGTAEALCFGSLLTDGFHIRLTGQDVQRGTFSHRHAVIHDQALQSETYKCYSALTTAHSIEITNSILSEFACLGFEVGYAMEHPDSLVIWEAQFGDFANGAQVIIDQFISAGEVKWGRQCGIVLNLPHGYDGQGPEHSSARMERFLQLCDDREDLIAPQAFDIVNRSVVQQHNLQVVNCSTPAQYFHVLRRQMHREFRKPLVIFSPKRLLKMRACFSKLEEMDEGTRFKRYIPNVVTEASARPEDVERLILCSGQVYYDLLAYREQNDLRNVYIARVEQLSPFPFDAFVEDLKTMPNLKSIVWAQEEPMNFGPWSYTSRRIETSLRYMNSHISAPTYAGRGTCASPAAGDMNLHKKELAQLLQDAFDMEKTTNSYHNEFMGGQVNMRN